MELIDVTTPSGELTGVRKPKDAVHRDGDWHVAAHVWITTGDGRIILQRRALTKENYPGLWDVSAAGHVSAGETAAAAAVRETAEELGVTLAPGALVPIGRVAEPVVLNGGAYLDNEIHEIFLVRFESDLPPICIDPVEVAEAAIITIDELRNRTARGDRTLVPHRAAYELLFAALRPRARGG